jgi:predicted CopG family antitoxin
MRKNKIFQLRLSEEQLKKLKLIAKKQKRSASDVLRRMINEKAGNM